MGVYSFQPEGKTRWLAASILALALTPSAYAWPPGALRRPCPQMGRVLGELAGIPSERTPGIDDPFDYRSAADTAASADFLEALLMVNHRRSGEELLTILLGQATPETSPLVNRYDTRALDPTEVDPAGRNFLATRRWLRNRRGLPTTAELRRAQRTMARGGVEGVVHPGGFRDSRLYLALALTPEEFREVQTNPYLRVAAAPAPGGPSLVDYPVVYQLSDEALHRLESVDPALARRIRAGEGVLPSERRFAATQRAMLEALTEERMRWYRTERGRLPPRITTRADFERFTQLVATLYRDLIAIHPFENTNGRTLRMYALYHLFEQEGFPPPRLEDLGEAYTISVEELARRIETGSRETLRLTDEVRAARASGRPWSEVPSLFFPHLPSDIRRDVFLNYARERLRADPLLARAYARDPRETQARLVEGYRASTR